MNYPYFVIKLLNPRNGDTIGYWRRDCYIPRLKNTDATRFEDAAEARGIALQVLPDHDFGNFMRGWRVQPDLRIIKVNP